MNAFKKINIMILCAKLKVFDFNAFMSCSTYNFHKCIDEIDGDEKYILLFGWIWGDTRFILVFGVDLGLIGDTLIQCIIVTSSTCGGLVFEDSEMLNLFLESWKDCHKTFSNPFDGGLQCVFEEVPAFEKSPLSSFL